MNDRPARSELRDYCATKEQTNVAAAVTMEQQRSQKNDFDP
jgi:hypothetical protein